MPDMPTRSKIQNINRNTKTVLLYVSETWRVNIRQQSQTFVDK